MLRPLRIAVSVVSGICCVLVLVLWVRSYSWAHYCSFNCTQSHAVQGLVAQGEIWFLLQKNSLTPNAWELEQWRIFPSSADFAHEGVWHRVPVWIPTLVFGLAVTAPWLRISFSLRTLLLATTAVALILGLIIYATRG